MAPSSEPGWFAIKKPGSVFKRLRGGQSTISDAINYIVEDWIDKNYIKLMRD
jgi:hypothetical protein